MFFLNVLAAIVDYLHAIHPALAAIAVILIGVAAIALVFFAISFFLSLFEV